MRINFQQFVYPSIAKHFSVVYTITHMPYTKINNNNNNNNDSSVARCPMCGIMTFPKRDDNNV